MLELNFKYTERTGCITDPILYNRFEDLSKSDVIVTVSLNKSEIHRLSNFIWTVYNEVLNDFSDNEFGYFDDTEEPFPDSPETILNNPALIDKYIENSNLWRDNILNRFLFPADENENYDYFIVGYSKMKFQNDHLSLSFYAVLNRNKK
jgi:hypothetical protein